MNEQVLTDSSRAVSEAILTICERHGFDAEQTAACVQTALMTTMANVLGPLGMIERLRTLADIAERDIMARPLSS